MIPFYLGAAAETLSDLISGRVSCGHVMQWVANIAGPLAAKEIVKYTIYS